MADDPSADSPLSRYLKKQGYNPNETPQETPKETPWQQDATGGGEGRPLALDAEPSRTVTTDQDSRMVSAPTLPVGGSESVKSADAPIAAAARESEPASLEIALGPAGFWLRAVALIFDNIILMMIAVLIYFFLPFLLTISGLGVGYLFGWFLYYLSYLVVLFFYFGWFYKKYGASPGKLALDLKVRDVRTRRHLGYIRTFFRETIGKVLSGMFFGLGFLIVVFRRDKRALHDLILETEVVRVLGPN